MTLTEPETEPATVTPARMRGAMGAFATGVTVITGLDGETPVGFACQSFASVSLEPPLVLFCADHRGRSWPRMREHGRFAVNVLGAKQADTCARFGSADGLRFEGLDWRLSRWRTPSLPGVLMRAHCEVVDVHVAGDHDVVVGQVLELEAAVGGEPLVFFRGRFAQ
ncbi:flavin reductase family protein [Nocardioides dubius]|uniref:Flavin-dependent monooxygenase reductase subunit HsaB n=1 Tax=Nocardioides dubius TaxID=317019 RepID=A0ABN1TUB9_9ACTN